MGRGLYLARIGGVEVFLDWSLLVIFALITVGLGGGLFAEWHADWAPAVVWTTAVVAAVSFFLSVLIHELSHAWVARARGIEVRRITLFIFGGMAQMEGEPSRWRDEFWMAIVGPFTSLVIGVVCVVLGSQAAGAVDLQSGNLEDAVRMLGPVTTVLLWLGPVNIILALFNLVPGFPLDGGRVLRAVLWGATGDLRRATRWAASAGRLFAAALIACGIAMIVGFTIPVFGTGLVNGLWLVLIGWFLSHAAASGFAQQELRGALSHVTVGQIMQADVTTVGAGMTVGELVEDCLMQTEQRVFPVVEDGELLGLIGIDDIRSLPRDRRLATRVREIMRPVREVSVLHAGDAAFDALALFEREHKDAVPVVAAADDRLLGLCTQANLLKWLAVHSQNLGREADRRTQV